MKFKCSLTALSKIVILIFSVVFSASNVFALDTEPPVLNSVQVSTSKVTVGAPLTITISATDTGSGIDAIWISLISPTKQGDTFSGQEISFGAPTTSQSRTEIVDYPGGIELGMWKVKISMSDKAGNVRWSYPVSVYVEVVGSGGNVDTEPPVLNSVQVSKSKITVGDPLTITISAIDSGSGIDAIWVSLISPTKQSDTFSGQQINFGAPTTTLSRTEIIDYPGGIELGMWKVKVSMQDKAGNIQWDYPSSVYVEIIESADIDDDSIIDTIDNCPHIYNLSQSDVDHDQIGDACDTGDYDGDGLPDYLDTNPSFHQTPLNDNTAFVWQVYSDFLNREADAGGLSYWVGELNAGRLTREALVEQYLLSPEFGEKVSPVTRLYFAYFNRLPDYSGLMYWVNEYASGNRTLNNISDAFAASTEFQTTYGSLNNGQFVDLIYTNLFDRTADPGGWNYWVSELDSGSQTRGQVMVGFSESQEYKDLMANPIFVTMTYIGLLRRSPDYDGYNYWVGRMDQGDSGQTLIDLFLSSSEYAARFAN